MGRAAVRFGSEPRGPWILGRRAKPRSAAGSRQNAAAPPRWRRRLCRRNIFAAHAALGAGLVRTAVTCGLETCGKCVLGPATRPSQVAPAPGRPCDQRPTAHAPRIPAFRPGKGREPPGACSPPLPAAVSPILGMSPRSWSSIVNSAAPAAWSVGSRARQLQLVSRPAPLVAHGPVRRLPDPGHPTPLRHLHSTTGTRLYAHPGRVLRPARSSSPSSLGAGLSCAESRGRGARTSVGGGGMAAAGAGRRGGGGPK